MPGAVARHTADGAARAVPARKRAAGVEARLGLQRPVPQLLAPGHERVVLDEVEALASREALGALTDEEAGLPVAFEEAPRHTDRMGEPAHVRHGAPPEACAVHEPGVELRAAVAVEHGAAPRVEGAVRLQHGNGLRHDVEGGGAADEQLPAALDRVQEPVTVRGAFVVGDRPRPAVDEERAAACGRIGGAGADGR